MKKMTFALITLAAALMTAGFSCVNDPFTVPVNLTLSQTYNVNNGNAGTNPSFGGTAQIALQDQIDQSYLGNITATRVSDLRVSTIGDFPAGTFSVNVAINGATILTVTGKQWNDFHTPQSVLASNLIQRNQAGVDQLLIALQTLQSTQRVTVSLSANGTIATPYPAGLQVQIDLISQVDAQVSGS